MSKNCSSATPSTLAAASASLRRADFTSSSVIPFCRHSFSDSPRSPYERQTMVMAQPRAACSAMAPPHRQTKSAECALTTSPVLVIVLLLPLPLVLTPADWEEAAVDHFAASQAQAGCSSRSAIGTRCSPLRSSEHQPQVAVCTCCSSEIGAQREGQPLSAEEKRYCREQNSQVTVTPPSGSRISSSSAAPNWRR